MATESVKLLIEAESQVEAETAKAEAELKKVEAAIEQETLALKRYKIAVTDGAEALDVFNLQLKGIDEQTAKTIAAERALIREMERVKKEAERPATPTGGGLSAGKGTKTASDLVRTIGSLTGSSEIASFAGGLGELSEKTEQFAEAGKKGGAGALALKAGLVAAVATIAFSAGKFLGDLIFQTKEFEAAMERAREVARKMASDTARMQSEAFSGQREDIELIRNPEEKQKAYKDLLDSVNAQLQRADEYVKQSEANVQKLQTGWLSLADDRAKYEQAQGDLANDKAKAEALREQQSELTKILGIEAEREQIRRENASADYLDSLREELKLLQSSADEQRNMQAERGGAVGADVGEAAILLQQIEAQKALVEAEKEAEAERKRVAEEAEAKSKRIQELRDNELDKLEQERIALMQGKEAADAFALAKQGLSQDDAERIAAARAELEAIKQQRAEQEQIAKAREAAMGQPMQAQVSRFLTRGNTDDKSAKLLEVGKKQLALQERQTKATEKLAEKTASDGGVKLVLEPVG